jgi:hypothetical protein
MVTPEERQAVLDEEHLRLLSLFHYISGGITVAFSLFFGVWIVFAAAMFAFFPPPPHGGSEGTAAQHPEAMPAVMLAIFGFLFAMGVAYGILEIVSGWFISRRQSRVFSFVVALPRVLFLPYGVILTIFTLLVLDRPSVKQLYRVQTGL